MQTIFDIGMHVGQDTAYYLAKGYRVIAVEANPILADDARKHFAADIEAGRLVLLNVGVGDKKGSFPFYVSALHSEWSSFDEKIGSRGGLKEKIDVPMRPFEALFEEFGEPYFVKIDIEGYDFVVLQRLSFTKARPKFISIENGFPKIVNYLAENGYSGFKFINQAKVTEMKSPTPALEGATIDWNFPFGASGPFGEDTPGDWVSREEILDVVNAYWNTPSLDANIHGWWDLHAKLGG